MCGGLATGQVPSDRAASNNERGRIFFRHKMCWLFNLFVGLMSFRRPSLVIQFILQFKFGQAAILFLILIFTRNSSKDLARDLLINVRCALAHPIEVTIPPSGSDDIFQVSTIPRSSASVGRHRNARPNSVQRFGLDDTEGGERSAS